MEDIIKGWRTRGSFGISSLWLGTNPTPSWKKKKTEVERARLSLGRQKQHPWSRALSRELAGMQLWGGSWLRVAGCQHAVTVDISGQRRTRPPLCPRGRSQLSLTETRGDSEGARVPAPQQNSSPGFASCWEILESRIRVHPLLPHKAPQPITSVTQRSSSTCILQSIPGCAQMRIPLCTSQGAPVLFSKKAALHSALPHDTASAGMEWATKRPAYSNHHCAESQSSLNMASQSSRTSKKSKIWHICQVIALFWSGVSLEPLTQHYVKLHPLKNF